MRIGVVTFPGSLDDVADRVAELVEDDVGEHRRGRRRPRAGFVELLERRGAAHEADALTGAAAGMRLESEVDAAFANAGLEPGERWSSWDREPFTGEGYVVTVHRASP